MTQYIDQDLGLLPEFSQLHIDRKVFLASFVSGVLTHIYCMVNLVENEDTITPYTQDSVSILHTLRGADTGRWLSGAVNWLQSWYRTPIVSGLLVILIIAILAQVYIRIFHIETAAGAVLTAVFLEVSSPTQAYITLHEVGYPVSALLAVSGVFFMQKGLRTRDPEKRNQCSGEKRISFWKTWGAAFLCESISLVILPVNISCSAVVILMLLIINTVSNPDIRFRKQWRWTLCCVAVLLCSGVFLLFSTRMIQSFSGVTALSYQGAEAAMNGSFLGSLSANYIHSFVKLFIIGVWKIQTLPAMRFAWYLCYALDLLCGVILLKKNRRRRCGIRTLHLILYVLLIPAAVCTISLVSYGFMYRGQHRMALILFLCGTIVLTERGIKSEPDQRMRSEKEYAERLDSGTAAVPAKPSGKVRMLYYVTDISFMLMIYAGFLFDNIGYVNQHHVMMQDQTLCTRILSALDQTEGFSYDQPVYFLNILSEDGDDSVTPMRYDKELYSVIWPVATTDLYAYGDSSLRFHMESYEGTVFEKPSDERIRKIEDSGLREEYADLKTYDFCILKEQDVWVIVVKTVMPPNVIYG